MEQQICIRFCVKFEHSAVETIQMVQKVFRDDAMSAAQIKVWHKYFKYGKESLKIDPHSEDLQQAETLRILNMSRLQSIKISN